MSLRKEWTASRGTRQRRPMRPTNRLRFHNPSGSVCGAYTRPRR
uniref:Uncharacterized protein n=1 Tax=Myoviridae sp. cte0t5 TaxID=2823549 RepID=A0A8S5LHA4_9CAUD|nr:MAG TPA: hypothetical protein [Myoviridae sp. cte0t5]